jgi:DnaK suppressor protein
MRATERESVVLDDLAPVPGSLAPFELLGPFSGAKARGQHKVETIRSWEAIQMDETRAKALIDEERARIQALLRETTRAGENDRAGANEPGDMSDPAESLTSEGTDNAVAAELNLRLEALEGAEQRLRAGTFGRSTRSGMPIPDERLEADPTVELTVEEATATS